MTTLFDPGDIITCTVTGLIKAYSTSGKDNDCYTIEVYGKDGAATRLYFDTAALLAGNAKKVEELNGV